MRKRTIVAALCLIATSAWSQEIPDESPNPLDALPGYWQFRHDDPWLGTLAAVGTVANLAPLFLPSSGETDYWVEHDGLHYFAWNPHPSNDGRSLLAGVTTTGIWGGFFGTYGNWDHYVKTTNDPRREADRGRSMGDYLFAPFQAEHVFNWDVMPMFPLLELYPLATTDWKRVGGFFQRDSVDFLGSRVSPAAGLAMTAAGAVTLVMANAALEEIAFRGLLQDRWGIVPSAVYFGANHLLNPFVLPNFSFEEAAQQAGFATLFGLYAGSRTEANGGDFRRMIALHFWHNVSSIVLSYLVDPEHAQLFVIVL